MTKLTDHFSLEECQASDYARAHGIDNSIPESLIPNGMRLLDMMEKTRFLLSAKLGKEVPIVPSSVYRCEELNSRVGGSSTSQHKLFQAMDYTVPNVDTETIFNIVRTSTIAFDQLILERDSRGNIWIHQSVPNAEKAPRRDVRAGIKGEVLRKVTG